MERVRRDAFIEAPPARIFDWLADPEHLRQVWPSMVEVSNVRIGPDGSHSFDWVYRMAGIRFHGHADTVEVERDRLRLDRNESGIPSVFRWKYQPHGEGTDLTLEIDYELPGAVFGRLAAPIVRRLNEREADALVHNLKERMEVEEERP